MKYLFRIERIDTTTIARISRYWLARCTILTALPAAVR